MPDPRAHEEPYQVFESLRDLFVRRYRDGSRARAKVNVLLGAGCSIVSGLPMWDEQFKRKLLAEASDVFRSTDFFVDECWRKLSGSIGLPPADGRIRQDELIRLASIEDIASVALESAVVADRVYRLLNGAFATASTDVRESIHPPQLAYELLAHSLKHGFVDHLITFNFDELLDEAVSNELGRDEYAYIASDHDITARGASRLPHLIKLHGTLGRPKTLRFTRTTTTSLPELTIRLLDQVLFDLEGGRPASPVPSQRDTHILSLGYGWNDPDVRHYFQARRNRIAQIFILAKRAECDGLRKLFGEAAGWNPEQVRILNLDEFCPPAPSPTVDLFLWALWVSLEERLKEEEIPFMPAARHLLLGYLFGPNGNEPGTEITPLNKHTPLKRFVVEFVLHLAKCKGMVTLSTMGRSDRIGRYYSPIRRKFAGEPGGGFDLLSRVTATGFLVGHTAAPPTIVQSQHADVKETFYATASEPKDLAAPLLNGNQFALGAANAPRYSPTHHRVDIDRGGHGQSFVERCIEAVFAGPEIEVTRRRDRHENWTLPRAEPIMTYIDLQNRTREILETDWTDLLVIAESGAWLDSPMVERALTRQRQTSRRVFLIDARQPLADEWRLRSKIAGDLSVTWARYAAAGVTVVTLPLSWWQHNRHLTLAISEDGGSIVTHGGIYFRRRHKASRIQPLFVAGSDTEDLAELLITFLAYALRALIEHQRDLLAPAAVLPGQLTLAARACALGRQLQSPPSVQPRLERVIAQVEAMILPA
jgi:hypothetical protein